MAITFDVDVQAECSRQIAGVACGIAASTKATIRIAPDGSMRMTSVVIPRGWAGRRRTPGVLTSPDLGDEGDELRSPRRRTLELYCPLCREEAGYKPRLQGESLEVPEET